MASKKVDVRRVYDEERKSDGTRLLVDRVWPRGVRKEDAHVDEWVKDVAPSTELRKWFGHDPERFAEFRRRYRQELEDGAPHDALEKLRKRVSDGKVTLVTATKDVEHSHATVLAELLSG